MSGNYFKNSFPNLFVFCTSLLMLGCSREVSSDGFWGNSKNKLRIHVEVTAKASNEHWVQVAFQNISDKPIQVWESGFWPNIMLHCVDGSGKSAETTVEGRNLLKAFSPGGSRTKNYLVRLLPKQIHYGDSVLLERVFELVPHNTYYVSVIYEETWAGGWTGSVTSNIITAKME